MAASKCTKELYVAFLQTSSYRYSGKALSEVSPEMLSHDSVSRWLKKTKITPNLIWEKARKTIDLKAESILIVDDTVLAKQRSQNIELVKPMYSGNAHKVLSGIGLVNMVLHNVNNNTSLPIDFRVYDKNGDGKTKNDHFIDMLKLAKHRQISPKAVAMDSWYASLKNLKTIRDLGWIWVTNLSKNRIVNLNVPLDSLNIPDDGLTVHLRGYGMITVFKLVGKNGHIDYIATNRIDASKDQTLNENQARWKIEIFHREIKQTCGIERCQAISGRAQRNHIGLAILAWVEMFFEKIIHGKSYYQQTWETIKFAITEKLRLLLQKIKNPSISKII